MGDGRLELRQETPKRSNGFLTMSKQTSSQMHTSQVAPGVTPALPLLYPGRGHVAPLGRDT